MAKKGQISSKRVGVKYALLVVLYYQAFYGLKMGKNKGVEMG